MTNVQKTLLAVSLAAGFGLSALAGPAAAMTPKACYKRDSQCTQFCGRVKNPEYRSECFSRCNIYLNNCLDRGDWTDRPISRQ